MKNVTLINKDADIEIICGRNFASFGGLGFKRDSSIKFKNTSLLNNPNYLIYESHDYKNLKFL
jgi:hypothetical protein